MNAVMHKVILSWGLCQYVSLLVRGSNWENLDESLADMLAEVVVALIDMLGARAKIGMPGKFQSS